MIPTGKVERGERKRTVDEVSIEAMQPLTDFNAKMEALIAQIKSVPLAQGFDEVFYPGEIEARNDAENRRNGLMLPDDTLQDLRELANGHGLPEIAAILTKLLQLTKAA
jgi:LDH2 family malate/lactate/ureidoglycolate dehydrogenase